MCNNNPTGDSFFKGLSFELSPEFARNALQEMLNNTDNSFGDTFTFLKRSNFHVLFQIDDGRTLDLFLSKRIWDALDLKNGEIFQRRKFQGFEFEGEFYKV